MSTQDIELTLVERKVQGKQVKQLRRDGLVPAVIHDHGKASKIVMVPYLDVFKVYQQAGKHHPLALTFGKDKYMAMIKDVDFDPKKHQLRHVVFNAIKQDEKVTTEVPIRLDGEIPAEKVGLVVFPQMDAIEIEAYPKDLVDEIVIDASGLTEIGDKITVADIVVPPGVTLLAESDHPIVTVGEAKEQIIEESEPEPEVVEGEEGEAGEEGAAEGEVGESAEEGEAKAKEPSEEE